MNKNNNTKTLATSNTLGNKAPCYTKNIRTVVLSKDDGTVLKSQHYGKAELSSRQGWSDDSAVKSKEPHGGSPPP